MKRTIVISIHTELHLILSISFLLNYYYSSNYNVIFLINIESTKSRLLNINYDSIHEAEIIVLESIKVEEFKNKISKIKCLNPIIFIQFLEQKPINLFLSYFFGLDDSCKIVLAPDGTKPYLNYRKYPSFSSIRDCINTNMTMSTLGIKYKKFTYIYHGYGWNKNIDELWVIHSGKVSSKHKYTITKVEALNRKEIIDKCNTLFNIDQGENIFKEVSNNILFINHPLVSDSARIEELETIKKLTKSSRKVFIKYHPLTHEDQKNRINLECNVTELKCKVPAELIIFNLKNTVLVSFWSASLLYDNEKCSFYWLFPILYNKKIVKNINITNPTKHIQMINNLESIINDL